MKKGLSGINNKLDKAWSRLVRARADNRCEYCGSSDNPNAHHVYGKRKLSTRWDVNNGVCLCASHHVWDTEFSAHATPFEFTVWFLNKKGEEFVARLRWNANHPVKLTKADREEMLKELIEELKKYE